MSTDYYIEGRAKPTVQSVLDQGITIHSRTEHDIIFDDGTNIVEAQVVKRGNGPERITMFTRYGMNNPGFMLDAIDALGFEVVSEYD